LKKITLNLEIIINLIQFYKKIKINMNDVTIFFVMNFHHVANIRNAMNINKIFLIVFTFLYSLNDIILDWVLKIVDKI